MNLKESSVTICLLKIILLSLLISGDICHGEQIYIKCIEDTPFTVPKKPLCIGIQSNSVTFAGGMADYELDESGCIARASCDVLIQAIRTEEELLTWLIYAKTNDLLHNGVRFSVFNEESRLNKPLKSGDIVLEMEDDAEHTTNLLTCEVKKVLFDNKRNQTVWMTMDEESEQNVTFTPTLKFEYVTDDLTGTNYTLCVFESGHTVNEGEEEPVDLNARLAFFLDHMQRTFDPSLVHTPSEGYSDWQRKNYVRKSPEFVIWRRRNKFTIKNSKSKSNEQLTVRVTGASARTTSLEQLTATWATNSLNDASPPTLTTAAEYENESQESNHLQGKGKSANATVEPDALGGSLDEINDPNVLTVNNGNNEGGEVNLNISNPSQWSSKKQTVKSSSHEATNEVTNEVEKFTSDPITQNWATAPADAVNFSATSEIHIIGRNATPFDETAFEDQQSSSPSSSPPSSQTVGTKSMQWIYWVAATGVAITMAAMVFVCVRSQSKNRRSLSIAYSSGKEMPSASSLTTSLSTIN